MNALLFQGYIGKCREYVLVYKNEKQNGTLPNLIMHTTMVWEEMEGIKSDSAYQRWTQICSQRYNLRNVLGLHIFI